MKTVTDFRMAFILLSISAGVLTGCGANEEKKVSTEEHETPFTKETKDIPVKDTGNILSPAEH